MGAFGELLIQRWGGDLDRYRGNTTQNKNIATKKTTEEEKEQFRYEYKISKAKQNLDLLTSNLMYRPQDAQNYTEESIKNGFEKLGFDVNIQKIMWDEYSSFLDKYIRNAP
tara:strand:+ start:646 stop:978 length:333 start_codon:yes stop_codon:yes gene_type:complete